MQFTLTAQRFLLTFCLLAGLSSGLFAQSLPDIQLKDLKGTSVSGKTFFTDGKPTIISFWATWCKPCVQELNAIYDVLPDWQEKSGVRLIAVSIDDSRTVSRVAPFVSGRGWDFEVYLDQNSDFRRAMNVNNPPHTFLVNGSGTIVWQHNGYLPGDEKTLFEEVMKMVK